MKRPLVLIMALVLLLTGCTYSRQIHRRSNVMSYLYPQAEEAPRPNPGGVILQLPLDIGVAFVPPEPVKGSAPAPGVWHTVIPAETEGRLLQIVRKAFVNRDWVGKIETIPSAYLVQNGGFSNLEQVSRMFDVAVVALVSVDQVQNSDPTQLSFLYLSIIGAYTLPLDQNETRTMIDVAAFHVPSRTFLLRAPGLSRVKGHSTAVTVDEELRDASREGFEKSIVEVARNLDVEIERFKQEIVSGERKDIEIVTKEGGSMSMGAAVDWRELFVGLLLIGAIAAWRRVWSSGV